MENRYLIDARMHHFWSLEEASKRIGVQKKTYERWEKGESIPYLKSLGRICTTFKEDDPEKLGYVIENERVRLKRSLDIYLLPVLPPTRQMDGGYACPGPLTLDTAYA